MTPVNDFTSFEILLPNTSIGKSNYISQNNIKAKVS